MEEELEGQVVRSNERVCFLIKNVLRATKDRVLREPAFKLRVWCEPFDKGWEELDKGGSFCEVFREGGEEGGVGGVSEGAGSVHTVEEFAGGELDGHIVHNDFAQGPARGGVEGIQRNDILAFQKL